MHTHRWSTLRQWLSRLLDRRPASSSAAPDLTPLSLPEFVTAIDPARPPRLALADRPRVSIVIPIHDQALHSYNCLSALSVCDRRIAQQVIIVDNGSGAEPESGCRAFPPTLSWSTTH